MRRALFVSAAAVWVACLVACGDRPSTDIRAETLVSGHVYVTGPVSGAVVSAYWLDPESGELGELVAESEPSAEDGSFSVDLSPYIGDFLLIARGAGASYEEPASGARATFEALTALRAVVVTSRGPGQYTFGIPDQDQYDGIVISPFSELAYAYAVERSAQAFEPFDESLPNAYSAFAQHLEFDFPVTVPSSFVEGAVGPWNASAHAGLFYTALSMHARRIAVASSVSPSSVSTLQLLSALAADLQTSLTFDGVPAQELGACPAGERYYFCRPTAQRTFRADLAESAALFLGDGELNTSGYVYNDIAELLDRVAYRAPKVPGSVGGSPLFSVEGEAPDGTPPSVVVDGLQQSQQLSGDEVTFSVTVTDAFALPAAALEPLAFARGEQIWAEGTTLGDSKFTVQRTVVSPTEHRIEVTVASTTFQDGPLDLHLRAVDVAGNTSEQMLPLVVENIGAGTVAGVVTIGGRLRGAQIDVYDMTDGTQGALVGSTTTESGANAGGFLVEIAEDPNITSLLLVARMPTAPDQDARYVDIATNTELTLGPGDEIRAALVDWNDGDNAVVNLSPFTEMATAFAVGLAETRYAGLGPAEAWKTAVEDAYVQLEAHFNDGNFVSLRGIVPADVSDQNASYTLNAQVRYGLAIAALSELAAKHAADSESTPAAMNTLTLTRVLASDLRADSGVEPLFNGRSGAGNLSHGEKLATSYWTRTDLAIALVDFIEKNPYDATPFVEDDLFGLLEQISTDDNVRLYPAGDPVLPYDQEEPTWAWEAPTPAVGAILRGTIDLRLRAEDNRQLAAMTWSAPTGISNVLLDKGQSDKGPWYLTGELDLEAFPDGDLTITAVIADDNPNNDATADLVVTVDRTSPTILVSNAVTWGGGSLSPGDVTGSDVLTVSGTASDAHAIDCDVRWNSGTWSAMPLSGNAWETEELALVHGANTLEVRCQDPAGNVGTTNVTYYRDAQPPTVVAMAGADGAKLGDELVLSASITGADTGAIQYSGSMPDVFVQDGVSYSKWADRYTAAGPNLPEWRFSVTDGTTPEAGIAAEYRVLREGAALTPWTPLPAASGAASHNRALTISSAVHESIGTVSGQFQLQVRASDQFGNVSTPISVSWTQTIRNPLVRAKDYSTVPLGKCQAGWPNYYSLGDTPCAGNTFGRLVSGSIPGGLIYVAAWRIDNPNSIPAHVSLNLGGSKVGVDWKSGVKYSMPSTGDEVWNPPDTSCTTSGNFGVLDDGTCYALPQPHNEKILEGSFTDMVASWEWQSLSGQSLASAHAHVIPPNTSVLLYAKMAFHGWLVDWNSGDWNDWWDTQPWADMPALSGKVGPEFIHCDKTKWVGNNLSCVEWSRRQEVYHLTRVKVDYHPQVTLRSRAGVDGSYTGVAGAENVAGSHIDLNRVETGYSPF